MQEDKPGGKQIFSEEVSTEKLLEAKGVTNSRQTVFHSSEVRFVLAEENTEYLREKTIY